MDMKHQTDKEWILSVQKKLYQWSRETVSVGTPDDTKRLYAEKAARQIEKIKSGEKVP